MFYHYDLIVSEIEDESIDMLRFEVGRIDTLAPNKPHGDSKLAWYGYTNSWIDWENDIYTLSRRFPNAVFHLEIDSEDGSYYQSITLTGRRQHK